MPHNTRRMNRLEELGRVDAERGFTRRGRRGTKGVCTGKKFGSKSCPPGSKRYNLAKTFKKMARKRG